MRSSGASSVGSKNSRKECKTNLLNHEQNTFSHCMYRREHCPHNTLHWVLRRRSSCSFNKTVTPSLVWRHVWRPAQHTQHFVLFCTPLLLLLRPPAQAQGWSRPEYIAQIHEALEVTVSRIHNLAQVMSPTELSTTRAPLSKRVWQPDRYCARESSIFWREKDSRKWGQGQRVIVRLVNQPVIVVFDSRFYWEPCYASAWTTNKFVLCWLHHGIYRSEKQVRTITNISLWKRRIAVNFIWKSELHLRRETCGMALISEKIGTSRIVERATCWCFQDWWIGFQCRWPSDCCKISSCGSSLQLYQWVSTTSLCSTTGFGEHLSRICWISTRTSSNRRRIKNERKSSSRNSNSKHAREGRNDESSWTTRWRIHCTEVEWKSWNNTEVHFSVAGNARKGKLFEWLLENSTK